MRIPIIIRAPGFKAGERRSAMVESIDLYPTLCELTGIASPSHLKGTSLVEVMKDPSAKGKTTAVGRYRTGDTIRTEQFRFTEYRDKSGKLTSSMLYDEQKDPLENSNVLRQHQEAHQQLAEQLNKIKGVDKKK